MQPEWLEYLNCWRNDNELRPLIRVCRNAEEAESHHQLTSADYTVAYLERRPTYLILLQGEVVGECDYDIQPAHLHLSVPGSAMVGITIGESAARGRGIGRQAMTLLETEIRAADLQRIELGAFEFNTRAIRLYQSLGYREIARLPDFTWASGRYWADIRMEKWLNLD